MTETNETPARSALVTGAGSGIGRATALAFAATGARVIASDIDPARLESLNDELGEGHVTVAGDITDPATIEKLGLAAGGRVDILANVAGIMDRFLPVGEMDDALWQKVFDVNVTAPMRLMRAVLPGMVDAGEGAIVNVASAAALHGGRAGAAYTASKHALIGLTRNTAVFYGPQGIRANVIAPGPVATGIEGGMASHLAAQRMGPLLKSMLPPPTTPDVLAEQIVWLASETATNINGAVLSSDGGWAAI
ncbi:SDR family NAD(P)-dependent oxidoreductase [Stakelama tenebrarum]|uniref:SDR family oxidoreductase n=1 Tax=Stakelama tenebrarum TaxID=2711215 RepID=A0A6G6Y2W5_9SPHN|nr:SDR family oxidoreductase [Sphingosinithalassobacter tenebrarum]QIG79240.1 SDR family oxidoreductase [Sphingosinithalassobacter tenebrarum]